MVGSLQNPRPPAAGTKTGWLSVEDAATRSGKSVGHLSRLCRHKWLGEGTARLVSGGGKRSRYEIREDSDPLFARVRWPEQLGTDLRHVPEGKRNEAMTRRQTLNAWERAKAGRFDRGLSEVQVTGQFLVTLEARGIRVSRATLYNWHRAWRRSGLAGLVDGRAGSPETAPGGQARAADDLFFEEVKRLYLLPRRLSLQTAYEIAVNTAQAKGWTVVGYERCRQLVKQIPAGVILRYRMGEEAFTNGAEPFIERDYATLSSNETWCGDHHQFDVIVNDGGKLVRPWLTAWQDLRSRKIVGWRVFGHDPNTDTILAAFRAGVKSHGVCEKVYVDNGKDYDSYALNGRTKKDRWRKNRVKVELDPARAGVFTLLGVGVTHAWTYHGQSKPIERFFRTVEGQTNVWDTYCGNRPGNKPEDLQLNLERGKAPSLADFTAWWSAWLDTFHQRPSEASGLGGETPDAVFAANLGAIRTATDAQMDAFCLKRTPPVKVGQNGVTYLGLRYGQYEPALTPLLGREVVLAVDDCDLSAVQVWSADYKFICLAPANQRLPANASAQELRDAIGNKKRAAKAIKTLYETKMHVSDDLPDMILRARHAANAAAALAAGPKETPQPPSIQPIRTVIDDQLPALNRAVEYGRQPLALAAGAEGMSLESVRAAMRNGDGGDDSGGESGSPDPFAALMDLSRRNRAEGDL